MKTLQVLNKQAGAAEANGNQEEEKEPTEEEKKKEAEQKVEDSKSGEQKAKEWFKQGDKAVSMASHSRYLMLIPYFVGKEG